GSLPPAGQALVAVARQSSGEEAVELGFSRRAREDRLRAIRQSLGHHAARAAGLMALCAILLAFPLSPTLTKRIRRIESALKAIGSGRREERLPALGADEIGRLAAGVNAMAEQLGELEQLKRTFVASVTHELRSPLDIMESYLDEILRRSQALSERDRADLLRVQGNARRLSHFVTNLLDYAKIERGKLDFAPRTADAAELVDNSVRFFAPKAREAGVALAAEIEPSLPLVRLDPDLYTHVLTNLLSNALKFTPAGGRIQVSLRRRANDLELAVADSGVGIKAPDLARLFLPFERISNPLRANGVGLGLAISRQIATLHRGRLGVVSEWGKGSRFSFTMPMS
ncbi:MAG: HAMP domain-containing histidine kinase, partial [Elusimicrobia bacterium]|nr:HAMP domain-containing histidine kinase [Elusimicrobiota bacterium]